MNRRLAFSLALFLGSELSTLGLAQSSARGKPTAIEVMTRALADWNAGDLSAFARCYKNSPDILFVGPRLQHGYNGLLEGYRKAYPTKEKMGSLSFSELAVQPLDKHFATMTGRFHLQRNQLNGGDQAGYFLLVFEKTPAGWKIVRDDSTMETTASTFHQSSQFSTEGVQQADSKAHKPSVVGDGQMSERSGAKIDKAISWTEKELREKADSWIEDWNSHDLDRILSHYASDVRFEANTVKTRWSRSDGVITGTAELREHFRQGLNLAPSLHFELEQVFFAPDGYAVVYRRENGNRVIDAVKLNEQGNAYDVTAYYAAPQR